MLTACSLLGLNAHASQLDAVPPWRDLGMATSDHEAAVATLADAEVASTNAEADLAALHALSATESGTETGHATSLRASSELATDLAVQAYITGRGLVDAAYVLDAPSVNDIAYRTGILAESADALATSAEDFLALRDASTAQTIALASEIEGAATAVEAAKIVVDAARIEVDAAAWVVEIATIHDRADALFEREAHPEPTDEQWASLRFCESTERYNVATGNGYWGAYQFDIPTWLDMGGHGLPSDAPPEEQDARARYLYHLRGWGPWPVCGRFLPQG